MNTENKKIILTKLKEADNPYHPNNIEIGYVKEGEFYKEPKVGESFLILPNWATSTVQEILSPNTFRTMNSIYKWEVITTSNPLSHE